MLSERAIHIFRVPGLDPGIQPFSKMMDCRAFAAPKGLRPRRRVKPGNDASGAAGA
jgi:hypothetical protein